MIGRSDRRKSSLVVVVVAALIAALAVACAQQPAASPTAITQPVEPPATIGSPSPAPVASPAAAPSPSTGGGAAPEPEGEAGSITIVMPDVGSGVGLNSAGTPDAVHKFYGVGEAFFTHEPEQTEAPLLVTEWTLDDGLTGATLKVRKGVQFHKGFGEMTAEDVAWSMNDANAAVNPTSIHPQAGDFAAIFGEATVIDPETFNLPFKIFDVRWAGQVTNGNGQGLTVFSKTAFDQNGADWMRQNFVATGPFEVREYLSDNRATLDAVSSHWRESPRISVLNILEIPDNATRLAMMSTGEADAAGIELKDVPNLLDEGFETASTGVGEEWVVWFAGNYWEKEHAVTGEPIDFGEIYSGVQNHPWRAYPDDAEGMESARKVRNALAMAVDRELLNEQFVSGLGWPAYIGFFSPRQSEWQDKWAVPYDPEGAAALLEEAGYPEDGGSRFNIAVYSNTETAFGNELADAVGIFWQDIGLDVDVLKYAYSIYRPGGVSRGNVTPHMAGCNNISPEPWDWPRGSAWTTITRGGFGCSVEIPKIAETFQAVSEEPVANARKELNNELADYMREWMIGMGVLGVPDMIVINPNSIESWEMRPSTSRGTFQFNSPERLVPAR